MDWATRRVLSWRLSNTLDARFCTEALERYGRPQIFNTDQGGQFTSLEFTATLKDAGVAISMDGRGRCMDNIFIERLWRSMKYEAVYLHELSDGFQAQRVIARKASLRPGRLHPDRGPTTKECCWRGRLSPSPRPPLCRLNRNTKTC